MSRASTLKKYAGLAGAAAGVVVAGAAAGILAERQVVARRRAEAEQPFGSLRAPRRTVVADDGLELHAEVEEADAGIGSSGAPTLIFLHGYALNLDSWHFQRGALRGDHRMVFYDQRSHGRSGRSRDEHCTIDQLGRDLSVVIDELAGDGPVVLVGHSMGGMTIMALAEQHPEWFGSRVSGVGLVSTSAGGVDGVTLGLPGPPGRFLRKVTPSVVAALARVPRLVEGSRRAGSDFGFALTRRLAFGGPVPQEYVDFTDEMLAATPIDVVAHFYPGFDTHDKSHALEALGRVPTVVVIGTRDAMTPIPHSRRIADEVASADLVELEGAGHMVLLERHDEVTAAIGRLVDRAAAAITERDE
ncbi:MAG: alpha/beta hydrolase [Nocardioidaceae bacterium]|nr:alpha/beta hydrolase [Nocardioidaceae bacterium]